MVKMALNPKYELIETEVLNGVCRNLRYAMEMLDKPTDPEFRVSAKEWVNRAYLAIEQNKKQCNVRPAEED